MTIKMHCGHDYDAVRSTAFTHTCVAPDCMVWQSRCIDAATYPRKGRTSKCRYCDAVADSAGGPATGWKGDLPFFEPLPKQDADRFYNGCRGWD